MPSDVQTDSSVIVETVEAGEIIEARTTDFARARKGLNGVGLPAAVQSCSTKMSEAVSKPRDAALATRARFTPSSNVGVLARIHR